MGGMVRKGVCKKVGYRLVAFCCGGLDEYKEVKAFTYSAPEVNTDNYIRYLGCGENRLSYKKPFSHYGEPAVDHPWGYRKLCYQTDSNRQWYSLMCGAGAEKRFNDDGKRACRMYGPFWGVYAAKVDGMFGLKPQNEVRLPPGDKCQFVIDEWDQNYSNRLKANPATEKSLCVRDYIPKSDEKCADPQSQAFKSQVTNGPAQYIYG